MDPKELFEKFKSSGGRLLPNYLYENSFVISDEPLYKDLSVQSASINIAELNNSLVIIGIEFIQKVHNLNELLTIPITNQLTHHQNVQFYKVLDVPII